MQKILVPVDGSLHALKALHIASDLAQKYGGSIVLLHVISKEKCVKDLLDLAVADTFGPTIRKKLQQIYSEKNASISGALLREIGEKILAQATNKVNRLGLDVEVLEMEEGDPVENILIARQRTDANTIVMGARGVSASGSFSFGSVSQTVFEKAPCTCLSVK
tara:strand:+ start:548 stop:1036 length:489 start_codon:yes stop_codon:yes gene_type:complete